MTTYTHEYMAWNLHLMSWKPGFQQVMVMKGGMYLRIIEIVNTFGMHFFKFC